MQNYHDIFTPQDDENWLDDFEGNPDGETFDDVLEEFGFDDEGGDDATEN